MLDKLGVLIPSTWTIPTVQRAGQALEAEGCESVWVPDSRFARDPFVALTALAATTRRMRLGVAALDPYSRLVPLVGMAVGALGELTGPRLDVALAAGSSGFDQLGLLSKRPVSTIASAVETLRGLLAGNLLSAVDGRPPLRLECPTPARLWVATRSPGLLRTAAEHADGVIIGHLVGSRALARVSSEIEAGLIGRALAIGPLARRLRVQVVLGGQKQVVDAAARRTVAWVLRQHRFQFDWLRELGLPISAEIGKAVQNISSPREAADLDSLIPDSLINELVIRAHSSGEARDVLVDLSKSHQLLVRFDLVDKRDPVAALASLLRELR